MSILRRLFSFSLIQLVAELLVVVLVFVLVGLLPPLLSSLHPGRDVAKRTPPWRSHLNLSLESVESISTKFPVGR